MFDTEHFINEIHTRPPLWNVKLKNRDIKGTLWIEVSSIMVQNWDELNNTDKNKEVKDLQRKWKSIRDAFTREVRLQKLPSGSGKRARKRYIYFNQLLFLLDTLEERPTVTNVNTEILSGDEIQNEDHESADMMSTGDVAKQISLNQNRRTGKKNASTFEQEVLQHIKSVNSKEEDDDEFFLLFLLPMFKKLDVRTKLWARMKSMETMQQAIDFGTPMPSPSSISNASYISAHPTFNNHTHPSSNNHAHLQIGNIIPSNTQMTNNIPTYPPFFQNNPTYRPLTNILAHPPMSNNVSTSYPQQNITKLPQPSPSSSTSRSSTVEPPAQSPTYTDLSSSHSQGSNIFDVYD